MTSLEISLISEDGSEVNSSVSSYLESISANKAASAGSFSNFGAYHDGFTGATSSLGPITFSLSSFTLASVTSSLWSLR